MRKEPPKRCEPPKKIIKIFNMARDTRKTLKRGKNRKWKVWEKVNNVKTTIQ